MNWWRRRPREEDLDRELRSHLDLEAAEQQDTGMSADQARAAAHRALGNLGLLKEDTRAVWTWTALDHLIRDLRYAVRTMRRSPGFSVAAILSLALGIGANTAIFSLFDALLLRSLPVKSPSELVQVLLVEMGRAGSSVGYPTILALSERSDVFSGVCGFSSASFTVTENNGNEPIPGAWVTGGYYRTLGLEPFAGRLLTPDDDRPGAPPVAVLSYDYWSRRFEHDFNAVGQSIRIEGRPVAIVGISPPGFTGANVGDVANLTLPLAALAQLTPERANQLESGSQWLRILARPQPGISMVQAKARLAVIWPQMASVTTTPRMDPKRREVLLASSLDLVPGGTGWSNLRNQFRLPLQILLGITGLVLLIACSNFANLLLARGTARSREIAVRFAIGAGRARIVRQLLTESLLLSALGALGGIGLAWLGSRLLLVLLSSGRRDPILLNLQPDGTVLLFTSAIALATGILFGLVPALRATGAGPGPALKADSGITPRSRSRLLPALVVSQVALSMVLLVGAGLFVRTLRNLEHVDPGFRHEGVLLVNLNARRTEYKDARLGALYGDLLKEFERIPGVVGASISSNTPLSGGVHSEPVSVNGKPLTRESSQINQVTPNYFSTMGTVMVLGRDFNDHDLPGAETVGIVNETFIRKYLAEVNPLGQRVSLNRPGFAGIQIVGVVKDEVSQSLRGLMPPAVYLPYFQYPEQIGYATFEIRATGSLSQTAALARDVLRTRFPQTPVQTQIEPLTRQVNRAMIQERLLAVLGVCFGALALVLASVGLYGLLAYTVSRSRNEIGIRMALGSQRSDVLWLVFRSAVRLFVVGAALGIPAAIAASRLVASMLFGLTATDPLTILGAAAMLGATVLVAAFLPAHRASRVDPMVALRYE